MPPVHVRGISYLLGCETSIEVGVVADFVPPGSMKHFAAAAIILSGEVSTIVVDQTVPCK